MSTVVTASSAIPMLSTSNAAINTALNYKQGWIGATIAPAASGPLSWLSGVLPTTSTAGAYVVDLLPIPLGTPGQGVQAWPGSAVVSRGAVNGPYLVNFNGTSVINLDAADTTNPRIDVVYVYVNDTAIGDAGSTNGGFMAVQNGTPSSVPAVPSIPSGAVPLAQIYRNTASTGGNTITLGNITDVRPSGGLLGGVRPLQPGDSLSTAGAYTGQLRDTTGKTSQATIDRWNQNTTAWETVALTGAGAGFARYISTDTTTQVFGNSTVVLAFATAQSTCPDITASGSGNTTFTFNRSGTWGVGGGMRISYATAATIGDFYFHADIVGGQAEIGGLTDNAYGPLFVVRPLYFERHFNAGDQVQFKLLNQTDRTMTLAAVNEVMYCSFTFRHI